MRTTLRGYVLAALAFGAMPTLIVPALAADAAPAPATPAAPATAAAPAAPAAPTTPAAQAAHYSVSTTLVGKMLDDPAANALLKKMIPTIYANEMFQSLGRDLTLQAIQQYEAELTEENLAKIQAELNKIPAKN
jgi:3-oxoacyl-ACP reductase-like protein